MILEKTITRRILKALNARPDTIAIKTHGSVYGQAGMPDIIGCVDGNAFALEVKRPGGKATPLQKVWLRRWRTAGAYAGVVRSMADVDRILGAAEGEGMT